jgi:formylglycine-generating enzyme required for sulfatase activity
MKRILFTGLIVLLACSSFVINQKPDIKLPKEFVKITGGTFHMYPDSGKRIVINEFYMSAFEVSNLQYKTFYEEVLSSLNKEEKLQLLPDTSKFNLIKGNTEPLKKFYYQNEISNNYPVVNISHYAATKYCEWLQEKIKKENPGYDVNVKLPSKEEWVWSAQAGRSQAMFPWSNYYLLDKKGNKMCHFKTVQDQHIYRNRQTGKPEISDPTTWSKELVFTSVVRSYTKNNFGLYNMCGNVAEMISEPGIGMGGSWNDYGGDVHIMAESKYEGASPMVGFRPVVVIKKI